MNTSPLVSIAMSVRNNAHSLRLAVGSLLQQSYTNWELILIDDGSTDKTPEILKTFNDSRIRAFVDGRSLGLPMRLNEAIDLSQGRYIARMDGDDVAYPGRLQKQVRFLEENAEVDLLGAAAIVFGDSGKPFGKRTVATSHEKITARPWAGFPMIHPTWMGRVEFFKHYRYRVSAHRCEDQDLLTRAFAEYPQPSPQSRAQDQDLLIRAYRHAVFANLSEPLLGYREERLTVSKQFVTRRHFARSSFGVLWESGERRKALWAIITQTCKGLVDVVALVSGLKYQILRHRAQSMTDTEQHEWTSLWNELNGKYGQQSPV